MTTIEKFKNTFPYQVTFSDCDPAKLAYYCRIIEWCDWSHETLWRRAGMPWHDFFGTREANGLPLLDVHISFHYPMRFGDNLEITSWIDAFEGRTFTVCHEIRNNGHLAAKCREKRAWVVEDVASEKGIRAVAVPEKVRDLFHREVK